MRILNSNLTSFWAPLRALPLASLLLLTAASDTCTIIVDDGDSGSEPSDGECPEIPEGCPLTCEVDDNGCTVCECDDIQVGCTDDSACGEGQVCVFAESCGCDGAAPSEGEGEAGDRAAPPCDCDVVGACQDDVVTSCADIVCEPGLECVAFEGKAECVVTPTFCESDSDCAAGEVCTDECNEVCDDGGCTDDCVSICLPVTNPCFSDADCAEGFVCEFASADPPVCDGEECAAPIAPAGQCVAQTGGDCFSDSDCPEGQLCGFFGAEPCFDCFVAEAGQCYVPTTCEAVDCGEGYVCVDSDFGPSCEVSGAPCVSDADCVESQHCDIGAAQPVLCDPSDPACDMLLPPPPAGICVADTNDCWALCGTEDCTIEGDAIYCGEPAGVACQADDACAMDQICNTVDFCLADPSCVDDAECPAVCFGMCVAAPTDIGCATDADCSETEFCNVRDCPQDAACFGTCETLVEG